MPTETKHTPRSRGPGKSSAIGDWQDVLRKCNTLAAENAELRKVNAQMMEALSDLKRLWWASGNAQVNHGFELDCQSKALAALTAARKLGGKA